MEIINILAYALCSASMATYILVAGLYIHNYKKRKKTKKSPSLLPKCEDATHVLPDVWKTVLLTSSLEEGEGQ